MGYSTRTNEAAASSSESTLRITPCQTASGWPTFAATNTSTGQCHRYHEYESFPITWKGRCASVAAGPRRESIVPAAISAAAPPAGTSAATPGNTVEFGEREHRPPDRGQTRPAENRCGLPRDPAQGR